MPFPSSQPKELSTTTASAWKKLFASTRESDRTGITIHNLSDGSTRIRVCVVQAGAAAPAAGDPLDDTMYWAEPQVPYPFGAFAPGNCDVYIRAEDDSELDYLAWQVMG